MAREPRDLSAPLERPLRERVPEAVERALLVRGPDPPDLGGGHRRVEVPPKQDRWREKAGTVLRREDEVIDWTAPVVVPVSEQLDNVGNEVDVPAFTVLRRAKSA